MKICDRCKKEVQSLNQIPGKRIENNANAVQKLDICDPCNNEYVILHTKLTTALFDAQAEIAYQMRIDWLNNAEPHVKIWYQAPPTLTGPGKSLIEKCRDKLKALFTMEQTPNGL